MGHSRHSGCLLAALLLVASVAGTVVGTGGRIDAASTGAFGACDDYSAEQVNEGYCPHRYKDTAHIWTIGVGFNLESNPHSLISECGGSYTAIMQGPDCCKCTTAGQTLSDSTINCLFQKSIASARTCGPSLIKGWDSLPAGPKSAITDMAYNMGCGTLATFHGTLGSVERHDFEAAAVGMRNSAWCGQVRRP